MKYSDSLLRESSWSAEDRMYGWKVYIVGLVTHRPRSCSVKNNIYHLDHPLLKIKGMRKESCYKHIHIMRLTYHNFPENPTWIEMQFCCYNISVQAFLVQYSTPYQQYRNRQVSRLVERDRHFQVFPLVFQLYHCQYCTEQVWTVSCLQAALPNLVCTSALRPEKRYCILHISAL